MNTTLYFIIVLMINFLFAFQFNKISKIINLYDDPNFIKIHKTSIACFGGYIFVFNIILFFLYSLFTNDINFFNYDYYSSRRAGFSFFVIIILFFFLGILDDKYKLSSNKKLILQFLLVSLAILIDDNMVIKSLKFSNRIEISLLNLSFLFTVLSFLIFINALNMFDGINNQTSIYVFIMCMFILYKIPNTYLIYQILIANCFFLYFNLQNKLFLGDNGSLVLGYLFANFFTKSHNLDNQIYADEIVIIMFFPVMDLLRLFFKRLIINKHPFSGDKNHLHHRLSNKFGKKITNFIISISIISSLILYQLNFLLGLLVILISYFSLVYISKNQK